MVKIKKTALSKPIKKAKSTKPSPSILLKPQKPKKNLKITDKSKILSKNFASFEDTFNIKIEDVENAVKGVIKLHSENPKIKNQLFEEDIFPISLKMCCHKIPAGHQKILRIPLAHSLVTPNDEICLIVSEVKGIGNKDHEKHVEHYENLLNEKGVSNIKKIMTVHELRTEHETYEQMRRLVDLYDNFLVCGKVCGKVVKKCGKAFYKKRKVPTPIKLQSTKLKEHIDKQLAKAYFNLHLNGDSYSLNFGHSQMDVQQIVENFVSVIEFLNKEFPGGFKNVKGLYIAAARATSIPVYVSTDNPNEIPKVTVIDKNTFKPKAVRDELSTKLNSEVLVKPSGQVLVINKNKEKPSKRLHEENIEEVPRKKLKSKKESKIEEPA